MTMEGNEGLKKETKRPFKKPRLKDLERKPLMSPLELGKVFAGASQILLNAEAAQMETDDLVYLIDRAFSNRCRTDATRTRVCRFVQGFVEFALLRETPAPFYGGEAVFTVVQWLDAVRRRGQTVPHLARYCLMAFGEALGVRFPIDHPAVAAAAANRRTKSVKSAEPIPFQLVVKLEHLATQEGISDGLKLAASIFRLMIFASLRFCDIRGVSKFWKSKTAICGHSLNRKDKGGTITQWAAPLEGLYSQ